MIAGAGLAGAKAAEALRSEGFEGRIVLVGDEPELPYERPPLSKDYLRGESPREQARVHEAGFYAEHDIELLHGTAVTELNTAARYVTLSTGERLGYDRLLLATGSEPRRLSVPGAELDGVHHLRTFADTDAIAAALEPGAPRRHRRRRLDRDGGRGVGAPEGARRHARRARGRAALARARPRGRA